MIALRKDVKVGFMIGGVVLGVFGVYLGLSALAGPKPDASATGASLQLTPFGAANTATALADRPARNQVETPVKNRTDLPAPQRIEPAAANPSQPMAVDTNTSDIWGNAFETGKIQPVVTVTPDPSNLPPSTVKPAEVISALSPSAGSETKTTETPTQTASVAEPSGSMASQTTSSLSKPAPDASRAGDSQTAASVQTHSIEVGETFTSIAANYYGDGRYFMLLIDANPTVDPNRLKPGTEIKVPALKTKEPRSDTTDVPAESRLDPTKQYVVKSGDSLSKIASTLYGDSSMWQKIYDLNKSTIGDSPAKLKLGMVLSLPTPPTR